MATSKEKIKKFKQKDGKRYDDFLELSPRKPDPWKNFLNLLQGKGFCDPKNESKEFDEYDDSNGVWGSKQSFFDDDATRDSTTITDMDCDASDVTSLYEGKNDQSPRNSRPQGNSRDLINPEIIKPKVPFVPEAKKSPKEETPASQPVGPEKPVLKSILKKKTPGPIVTSDNPKETKKLIFFALFTAAVFGVKFFYSSFSFSPSNISEITAPVLEKASFLLPNVSKGQLSVIEDVRSDSSTLFQGFLPRKALHLQVEEKGSDDNFWFRKPTQSTHFTGELQVVEGNYIYDMIPQKEFITIFMDVSRRRIQLLVQALEQSILKAHKATKPLIKSFQDKLDPIFKKVAPIIMELRHKLSPPVKKISSQRKHTHTD